MQIIKKLSEQIEEELDGAEEYIEDALKYREKHPELARTFYEISVQEMNHVNMLHAEAAKMIAAYRNEHGEPPAAMQAVYDYMHERHVSHAGEIKMMQAQYREV